MVSELWKGRYKGEEVALKAFKVPRGAAMSVSVFHAIQKEGCFVL